MSSPEEPTLADVLAAIGNLDKQVKDLRSTTVQAHGDQRRELQRQVVSLQRSIHLEMQAVDGRVAVVEGAVQQIREISQTLQDLQGKLDELGEKTDELLSYAHRHPDGVL